MAYTNKTPHYDLPQWIATDKPSYLSDQNQAYLDIDTAIFDAKTTAESSGSVANSALGAASAAQTAAESANTAAVAANANATEAKTSATQAITSATEANTAATNAAAAAQTAQTTAEGAKSTAESAQSAASAAAGSASTAQSRANEAYTLAQGASTTAGNANAAAQNAMGQVQGRVKSGLISSGYYDKINKVVSFEYGSQAYRTNTSSGYQIFMWQANDNPFNFPNFTGDTIESIPIVQPVNYKLGLTIIGNTAAASGNALSLSTGYIYNVSNTTVRCGYNASQNHSVVIVDVSNLTGSSFTTINYSAILKIKLN